ncbi:MAG: hypothetical protein U0794_04035 [Isosphaeraceae bacterium]
MWNRSVRARSRRRPVVTVGLLVGLGLTVVASPVLAQRPASAPASRFRAGAATSNISPWIGLSINGNMTDIKVAHVHDELHARALVLDDGQQKLAFVVADSCMIPREVVTDAKQRISSLAKIPADHVVISATHSHSCPTSGGVFQSDPDPNYRLFLAVRIADAVVRAVNNLAPAKIGWGVGTNAEQVNNRRWHMKPGTIPPDPFGRTTDRVKMNPPIASPDLIKPAGPIDPDVSVVSVQHADGRPLALLANYSLHYVGGVGPGHSSADYFGAFADRVQQLLQADRLDPPFVGMMTNGTSGDINNINFQKPRPGSPSYARIRLVADEIAQEAVRVARGLSYHDHARLDATAVDLKLGVARKPTSEEVERAERIVAKAKGPEMRGLEEVYARETIKMKDYPDEVDVTVQALRVGELGIVLDPVRGLRRDRPGDQGPEPVQADVHDRAGQRLQRLSADPPPARAGRLRDLARPVELSRGRRGREDPGGRARTAQAASRPDRCSDIEVSVADPPGTRDPTRQQRSRPLASPDRPAGSPRPATPKASPIADPRSTLRLLASWFRLRAAGGSSVSPARKPTTLVCRRDGSVRPGRVSGQSSSPGRTDRRPPRPSACPALPSVFKSG